MEKIEKQKIKALVLSLKKIFEEDIEIVLKRYGIYVDKDFVEADKLTHLSSDELRIKERLEKVIEKEFTRTDKKSAKLNYIKEVSYTYINRLLGLKCMEARGIIEETITTRPEYSNRSYRHRNFRDANPNLANKEDDGLIPFLNEVFKEITQEIKVLFDPDSDYSVICPRYSVLKQAIDIINALDYEVYKNDDFLGWVYQYFNDSERSGFKNRQKLEKKAKAETTDIPIITQLYTPKWIVEYLVNNSLGTLWAEMFPQTRLINKLNLLFSETHIIGQRTLKEVKDINLLDPACGSGHFLIYAFDLFYQMYLEEGKVAESEIPEYILKYNLYGIDIDLRAIQLTALSLYIKAKTYNKNFIVSQMNFVCADTILINGNKLEDLKRNFPRDPLAQEIIDTIWTNLQNVKEFGSLIKIEQDVNNIIEQAISKQPEYIKEHSSIKNYWLKQKQKINDTLKDFIIQSFQTFDIGKQLFANEAIKGVQLLDLLEKKYDVVATNPPYLDKRDYNPKLSDFLKKFYEDSYGNLYSAFIERCGQLAHNNGKIAMITPQTYMFLTTYSKLREHILNNYVIEKFVHNAFGAIEEATVDTAMFVFNKKHSQNDMGLYYRLVQEEEKEKRLKELIEIGIVDKKKVFAVNQNDFKIIDGWPFVYWIGKNFFPIFSLYKTISDFFIVKSGMRIGNNDKYLRKLWEINFVKIGQEWHLYNKGGDYCKHFGNNEWLVNWRPSALKFYDQNHSHRNKELYFKEGFTYSDISSKGFSCRYIEKGFVYDAVGPILFSNDFFVLGYMNSKLFSYILNILNPTIHFQVNDINRIPFKQPNLQTEQKLSKLAQECVNIKKDLLQFVINDREFKQTAIEWAKKKQPDNTLNSFYKFYLDHKESEYVKLNTYEGMIDKEVFNLYEIKGEDLEQILEEQKRPPAWLPVLEGFEEIPHDMLPEAKEFISKLDRVNFPTEELDKLSKHFKLCYEKGIPQTDNKGKVTYKDASVEDIALELNINPVSVLALRKELDLINEKDLKDEVENFLSHFIIEQLKQEDDGIIALIEEAGEESLITKLRADFEKIFGEKDAYNIENEMTEIFGKKLQAWLESEFFGKHIKQYKKRPVVWQINSPDKTLKVLINYHKLDGDTLNKLKTKYLWKILNAYNSNLKTAREKITDGHDKDLYKQIGKYENGIADLEKFEKLLEGIVDSGYNPIIDDGVRVNIAFLQKAGILASEVLDKKDADKAITDLEEWKTK